jgi:ribosomal protein S27E
MRLIVSIFAFVNCADCFELCVRQKDACRWYNRPDSLVGRMPDPSCKHARTQVIAKDEDAQYVECLDCGEILESGEITDGADSTESLSDA